MRKFLLLWTIVLLLMGVAPNAQATPVTLGFDGAGDALGAGASLDGVGFPYTVPPSPTLVTFENGIIAVSDNHVKEGYTLDDGRDDIVPSEFSPYFMTDLLNNGSPAGNNPIPVITANFAVPVVDVSFYALDIDGNFFTGYDPSIYKETLYAQIWKESTLVDEIVFSAIAGDNSTNNPGDGEAILIAFDNAEAIDQLRIWVERGDKNAGGYGVDNVSFNPVPEPATMLLLGSGLIGLAGFGRKKLFKK